MLRLLSLLLIGVGVCISTETVSTSHTNLSAQSSTVTTVVRPRPVLLIPGFASSQLQAWKKHSCTNSFQKNLYSDVNVGDRLWVHSARILAQCDCWLRCMKLHIANQTEIECKLRAAEGLSSISELDPGFVTGPMSTIWRGIIKDLVEHFDLGPEEIIVAPYDWRLPSSQLQKRDKYFFNLKRKIEHAVSLHEENGGSGGLVVIAHSMGNNVFRYFLAWLKRELDHNLYQPWIDRHVSAFFAVGAPLLGSSEALELITSGITQGLPIAQSEMRKMVATFGSIIGFLPIPSIPPTSHDADVLVSMRYQSTGDNVDVRNYTSVDIASGAFFRDMAVHDPTFGAMEEARQRFYVQDDVLDAFVPWERPPIASVYAIYGINLPTKYNYRYQDTDTTGHWYQVALENEEGLRQVCSKTGDGTVPYHSLSWAHSWLGPISEPVDITRAPQSVYFSANDIQRFQAKRQADKHHADYLHVSKQRMCSAEWGSTSGGGGHSAPPSFLDSLFGRSTRDQIAFFESAHKDKPWTTSVWEVDGARHREILGHPTFLRELRAELRHLFSATTSEHTTDSSTTDGTEHKQPSTTASSIVPGTLADKTARPPAVNEDCYWNYRYAKCEFADFCEYHYQFGDVTLDQSCRLRPEPRIVDPTLVVEGVTEKSWPQTQPPRTILNNHTPGSTAAARPQADPSSSGNYTLIPTDDYAMMKAGTCLKPCPYFHWSMPPMTRTTVCAAHQ